MLHKKLQSDMQQALKDRDETKLNTLRLALAACTEALVASSRKPTDTLDDEEVLTVLRRTAKQRRESADQYRSAGHSDRADAEDAERAVLEGYLPPTLSDEDIRTVVLKQKEALSISEKKDIGRLIKAVMAEVGDQADGSDVARIVSAEVS
ncbi:MAG: GatB/YqeY domain-containing protein [Candidatus Kaiserbacteria bacterium]|nr:GatB/YqeY domain-containing protein [Candidatus Kaiserbacteria bacterium]